MRAESFRLPLGSQLGWPNAGKRGSPIKRRTKRSIPGAGVCLLAAALLSAGVDRVRADGAPAPPALPPPSAADLTGAAATNAAPPAVPQVESGAPAGSDASTTNAPASLAPSSAPAETGDFLKDHPEAAPAQVSGESPQLSLRPSGAASSSELNEPGGSLAPEDGLGLWGGQPNDLQSHLLVVYNSADPDSGKLAQYYAEKRDIPAERVLGLKCPLTEEITRVQYDETIREPIAGYLTRKDWMLRETQHVRVGSRYLDLLVAVQNDIWAIVLIRGMPLKIAADPTDTDVMEMQVELHTDAAAVDSELALLPVFGLPKGGYVPNVFYDEQGDGAKHVGSELARSLVLVTRLDGPTPGDVRRVIDDTLYAETHRLAGLAVIDSRGLTDVRNGYTSGDIWLRSARDALMHDGWEVKFDDKPDVLPATDPCNDVALYLGWYAGGASGPWVTTPNRFVPGAIAYHLHSFSAVTVRSPTSNWVGPLIAHGAAATMGTVYEPYLALTPHMDIFARRLLQGDYFAEAAYASERAVSWMLTVVGDPLYRPFRVPLDDALAASGNPHTPHDDWLLLQHVQRELQSGALPLTVGELQRALDVPSAGPVAAEGLGDLLEKIDDPRAVIAVDRAYRQAAAGDTLPVDRIRVGLKLAQYDSNHGEDGLAQAELDSLRELYLDDSKRFGVADSLVPTTAGAAGESNATLPQLPKLPKPKPAP